MSRSGRKALLDDCELSSGPTDGCEALPDIQEWSDIPAGCLVVVGRPSRMSRSGLASHLDVREALPDFLEWSANSPGCPGVVGRPTQMTGSGLETLPDVRECSGDLCDVREWSVGHPGCQGVVGGLPRWL